MISVPVGLKVSATSVGAGSEIAGGAGNPGVPTGQTCFRPLPGSNAYAGSTPVSFFSARNPEVTFTADTAGNNPATWSTTVEGTLTFPDSFADRIITGQAAGANKAWSGYVIPPAISVGVSELSAGYRVYVQVHPGAATYLYGAQEFHFFTVSSAVLMINGETLNVPLSFVSEFDYRGEINYTPPANNGVPVQAFVTNSVGMKSPLLTFGITPRPVLSVNTSDLPTLLIDTSESSSLTSVINQSNVKVFIGGSAPSNQVWQGSVFDSTSLDLSEIAESVTQNNFSVTVTLETKTVAGCASTTTFNASLPAIDTGERSDSLSDEHGTLFTAANVAANSSTQTGTGVQITRHEINNAGQYTASHIQAIYDVKNPTLLQQRGTHGLFVFAQNRTSKVWQLWHSDDYGEAFELMANSPLDGNYKSVVACSVDSGLALAGIKKSTSEIWFARSWDGIEYDAIEGGTGTGSKIKLVGTKAGAKTVSVSSEEAAGGSRLMIVVDGTPFKFSDDFGDEWENAQ